MKLYKHDFTLEYTKYLLCSLEKAREALHKTYEENSEEPGIIDWVAENEEELLGLAYIVSQNYIISAIRDKGKRFEAMKDDTSPANGYSKVECLYSMANYQKHKDEGLGALVSKFLKDIWLENEMFPNTTMMYKVLKVKKIDKIIDILSDWGLRIKNT
jgi:hypothetical protein